MNQRMGSPMESRERGQGEGEWVPMAAGLWLFKLGRPSIRLSGFKNDDGTDKYRVEFPLQLTDEEYERARQETPVEHGQQVSGRVWYRVGLGAKYPLGFYRDDKYVSTKLADFVCAAFGSKQVTKVRRYLEAGGGPDWSACEDYGAQIAALEDWLGWLEDMQLYGSVTHDDKRATGGRVWAVFGGPLPVGSIPGQPKPDYQAFGAGKLRAMTTGDEPEPSHRDGAAAEQGIEEGLAAKAEQPELVTAGTNPAAQPRSYDELFGNDKEQDEIPS